MDEYPLLELVFKEGGDSRLLTITDASLYAETPVNPMLDIRLPGYTAYRSIPFNPKQTNTFSLSTLGLQPAVASNLSAMPDGVYEVIYRMCPYDTEYKQFYWLRDDSYQCQYLDVMSVWLDKGLDAMPDAVKRKVWFAELYHDAAGAAAAQGYVSKASKYYQKALTYLTYINKASHGLRLSE